MSDLEHIVLQRQYELIVSAKCEGECIQKLMYAFTWDESYVDDNKYPSSPSIGYKAQLLVGCIEIIKAILIASKRT